MAKQIIEINGVKLEVDLRNAKRVDHFTVGSRVKILEKPRYDGGDVQIFSGVIVGFEQFASLPTIVVAYIATGYNESEPIKICYINEKTQAKYELIADRDEVLPVAKEDVLHRFSKKRNELLTQLETLDRTEAYFNTRFGQMYGDLVQPIENEA